MAVTLSTKQKQILNQILQWQEKNSKPYLTLGGYAGTGKTTLISYLSNLLRETNKNFRIAYCSYTGKAARVLRQKLKANGILKKGDSVSTIHRLIYSPVISDENEIIGWEKHDPKQFPYKLIIVDEASMVDRDIWNDLLSFDVPILAVGDHGQLPPIRGNFNLMSNPELRLEEIFRQEKESPIIQISEFARRTGHIPIGKYGDRVYKFSREDSETREYMNDLLQSYNEDTMVLVGYNHTRLKLNNYIRGLLEINTPNPQHGERVICLKNNHKKQIFNGMTGTITDIREEDGVDKNYYKVEIALDGEVIPFSGNISLDQFGADKTIHDDTKYGLDLFDYSYAITVHKSQGSQANRVIVFEERFKQMDDDMWKRWLYTAVTRAENELYIIGS